ncbi:alpha/beta-hydrolase [Polyplosphaeria fusca]|uniref:Alpha/beta-hydrolase n=1 Tax=Polyplosphaeria fusca TaxID=682080 RepID=A0A9P4V320_9PLEO|nr:alpha/beta-hydrolase [Polyplosphaeria fusca]
MPFGPFTLTWHSPTPNPPNGTPLPPGLTRTTIPTPSGPLELLSALPSTPLPSSAPPLLFAHGGFGCAEIWSQYLLFFAARGYAAYAISYRGHGKSWYPGFWGMYFTSRGVLAGDLVAGVREVGRLEGVGEEGVVLVAHSAGAALSQYVLSRGMVRVRGFCMFGGVPGFGSVKVYSFWSLTAPIHFPYRLFHPRYILATTQQVRDAFFTKRTPLALVKRLEGLLSPYESMLWPMQMLPRVVTGPDVLASIVGWRPRASSAGKAGGVAPRLMVLAAEHDVLCTPAISLDAAQRYRGAFRALVAKKELDGISAKNLRTEAEEGGKWDGVGFKVVPGVAHHMQNEEDWERGAQEILRWVEDLRA